jgi:Kef-type K+ transport system membrane component KefB
LIEIIRTLFESLNELLQLDILTVIGLLIVVAFLGSKIFQRFGIPQVVGFIVLGVLHGPSFLNVIPLELSEELLFISEIALGLIGFDIGSHLIRKDLRQLGGRIFTIVLFEAFGTFLIVTAGVYAVTQSLSTALLFGALSSATAPAATVDVLAEYDAEGPLTTSILAVVGLDDAMALVLFSISATVVESNLTGAELPSIFSLLKFPLLEIGGSLGLGISLGLVLDFILCRMGSHHDAMAVSIGFVFLGVGISGALELSLILTSMIMGVVVVNRNQPHARHIRYTIEQAGPVIYVLFFALVGARLQIKLLPAMGMLGVIYIVLRSLGKFGGAWLGGRVSGVEPVVRDNLGFGLLSQAGVAIGLALASASRFSSLGEEGKELSDLIINVITATTFVVQIIGPIFVKFAISRAGEMYQAKKGDEVWASEGVPE